MATKSLKKSEVCPFWASDSMKCKLCNDGLFIPLEDHIKIYCKTDNHPQCLQYSLYADSHFKSLEKSADFIKNRRKHPRVEVHHKVTLIKFTKSGEIATHYPALAQTLDVGAGGMRVIIDNALPNDAEVQFSFDDSFPEALQSGMGRIEWCNKQLDNSGYHAGLSFQGKEIGKAMEFYLGIHN